MKVRSCFLTLLLIGFSTVGFAQSPWTRILTTPQENHINDVTLIPGSERLIAVTDNSTVMTSDDHGVNWNLTFNPAGVDNYFNCNTICFIDDHTAFIGGSNKTILKSVNGGETWSVKHAVPGSGDFNINDICFINDTTGFATGDNGLLLRTDNRGENWESIETGVSWLLNDIIMKDDQTGYILNNNYFKGALNQWLTTADGGNTWVIDTIPIGNPEDRLEALYYLNDSTGLAFMVKLDDWQSTIYKTTDSGATWNQVLFEWGPVEGYFDFFDELHGIAVGNTYMYYSQVFYTDDGGSTWTASEPKLWGANPLINTTCCYSETEVIAAGLYGAIFKSNDRGITWSEIDERLLGGNTTHVQFVSDNIGFVHSDCYGGGVACTDIFKTTDGGTTWGRIPFLPYTWDFISYFLDENRGFMAREGSYTYTIDGGVTWPDETIYTGCIDPQDIKFFDGNTGIITDEFKILKTEDTGHTWQVVSTDLDGDFSEVEFITDNDILVGGANEEWVRTAVFRTTDGGISWTVTEIGNFGLVQDIFRIGMDTLFLSCQNKIIRSVDGGNSWDTTCVLNCTGSFTPEALYFPNSLVGFAVGEGEYCNMMKTVDGGLTWNAISANTASPLHGLYFSDADNGMIFGAGGVAAKTTTGGVVDVSNIRPNTTSTNCRLNPNPFSTNLRLTFTKPTIYPVQLSIADMSGKEIKRMNLRDQETVIQLEEVSCGFYIFVLTYVDGTKEAVKGVKVQ